MPNPGDILDAYRLDAVIGRGGMGTVYRATDLALEKTVAVKVIASHLADDEAFVRRFREEAKALAQLDADGIVDVYTMRETTEALFFVMEHVEGPSLQRVLQRRGTLDPSQAAALLHQMLTAVQHAHASGILHRDLKPSNILLDADGCAVITDFGLAKILASDAELTGTYERLGTVAYMSPEQIEGLRNVEEASDLFSVGLIAYEMLTGRLPFDTSASDFVVQRAIVEESFPPPSTYASGMPPAVETVVLDLLAKDPAARPSARAALDRIPAPYPDDDTQILDPESSSNGAATPSVAQWSGLIAVVVLVLGGTYVGVRATLNLPIFSLSAPTPADSTELVAAASSSRSGKPSRDSADMSPQSLRGNDSSPPDPQGDVPLQGDDVNTPTDTTASTAGARTTKPEASPSTRPVDSSADSPDQSSPQSEADSAPPSEPSPGAVTVRTQPTGTRLYLDDSLAGRTPLTVDALAPGSYRVTLRHEGHRSFRTTIRVSEGDTTSLAPTLSPRPAVVTLRAVPSGTVLIDGSPRAENTSAAVTDSLSPGRHRLTLISDLGRWETQVELEPDEQLRRVVDFTQKIEGAVTARTPDGAPLPNATVWIDGSQAGYTPQQMTLRVGQHTIRVDKDGYVPVEQEVVVESDMETPIVFELAPDSE